jgi:DUF4097 and DUF4098 domain-containing protein YvlB
MITRTRSARGMGLAGLAALLAVGGTATAAAGGNRRVATRVKGTVTVEVAITSGDIDVKPGRAGEVVLEVDDDDSRPALSVDGNRVVARLEGPGASDDVTLWVPRGSHVEVSTTSGDIDVAGVGNADLRTTSGSIDVDRASSLIARVVSGRVKANGVPGAVRVKTVSGSAEIDGRAAGAATRLEFETTSGDLEWVGTCGRNCRMSAATLSGDIELGLGRASSFEVRFSTFSGDLEDRVGLGSGGGSRQTGRLGKGEGRIDCETYSGSVQLTWKK